MTQATLKPSESEVDTVPDGAGGAAAARSPVTVIVLTRNEEANIGRCLDALDWAEDVVLVDSGSTDGTVMAGKDARPGLRVFDHPFRDFGDQRNWALENTGVPHDWVLFLDADEVCTPQLASQINRVVRARASDGDPVGYYLTCRNLFLGRWLKRCTMYPSWQLRLLRLGKVRYRKEGHGQREVTDGRLEFLDAPYDHYGFSQGIEHWVARHNRYSSDEVELVHRLRREPLAAGDFFAGAVERRRMLKRLAARVGCRPLMRFLYLYVARMGFLDGHAGWVFCQLRGAHEIHITAKLAEARFRAKTEATR